MRVDENRQFRLTEHIDETRSSHKAAGIDITGRAIVRKFADLGDASIDDSDVTRIPGRAGPVHDVCVTDYDVEIAPMNEQWQHASPGGQA